MEEVQHHDDDDFSYYDYPNDSDEDGTGSDRGCEAAAARAAQAAAAAEEEELVFLDMTAAHLRQWVEANPGRVNDVDRNLYSPLCVAARKHSLSLVVWLLDRGADVPVNSWYEPPLHRALHKARTVDIITELLDRGADPVRRHYDNPWTPLMSHSRDGFVDGVARLLQDPRVRATINLQNCDGRTALHIAC